MSVIQIVCDNCGAKYKLPETSTASKAKCKQCGSVIDVASQRTAATAAEVGAAAPAMPAAARPASSPSARGASSRSASSRGGSGRTAAPARSSRSEPADDGQAKSSNTPLILGAIGGVAILVVVAIFALGGNKKPAAKKDDVSKAPAAAPAADQTKPQDAAVKPATVVANEAPAKKHAVDDSLSALAPAAGAPSPQGQKPADKPATKPADKPEDKSAAGKPVPDPRDVEREKLILKDLEAWQKLQVKSMDQVIDVKKTTQPLDYPPTVTDDDKKKMADLFQKAKDGGGGARTRRAFDDLAKMGHPALFFLVNQLRDIDYKNADDSMFGYQINMTLSSITMGINTGYVPVTVDEQIDPRKAQWNATTVDKWIQGVKAQWPTKEKFDEYIKNRKAKKDAELEGLPPDQGKKK